MTDAQLKTRTAAVTGTGRTTFRLDAATWEAIDKVADEAGMTWVEWATAAIAKRPHRSKAAAVRAALADSLLNRELSKLLDDVDGDESETAASARDVGEDHPIIGTGYHRLDDQALQLELEGATITARDGSFVGFELIVGYRDKSFGQEPFIAIKNRLHDAPHLFISPEAGK
ncbi:hypothetical protein [Dechloromonas denitrificans]|uniref:hypothetical protein n=1 Tax=Dechloromonas denitrificans TaxID=281362 RepID=UPI001CFB2F60|nr:hypothetical protein [Dechloromonas denitrificans]UCV07384.1 hypothetical protein KI615_18605 [Dechloromonas denitrificans]